jgi:hypothetical protein
MAASLREALESAVETEEAKPENIPAPAVAEAAPAADAPTGASVAELSAVDEGTPAEVKPADPTDTVKPEGEVNPVAEAKPLTPEEKETARLHRIDRPPTSWKKEAKGEWAALPLGARQEIHKREAEINRVLAQSAPDRQLAEQFKTTVQPFMARIQSNGIDPVTAARNLFEADHRLATGHPRDRAQYMAELIVEYGISVEDLDTALAPLVNGRQAQPSAAAPAGGIDPSIQQLIQQQLSQALAPILQERQQAAARSQQEVEQTVESMALDPKYPFFEDVRMDMADLVDLSAKRGVVLSLDEAYSRAVRMNPDTYGQLERQSTVSAATQAHQAALKAKAAASSVSGAPAGGGGQFNGGDGSLRGAIEAAFGGQRL